MAISWESTSWEDVFVDRDDWPWDNEYCGHTMASGGSDLVDSYRLWECPLAIPVEVPGSGEYTAGLSTWILDDEGRDPQRFRDAARVGPRLLLLRARRHLVPRHAGTRL